MTASFDNDNYLDDDTRAQALRYGWIVVINIFNYYNFSYYHY